MALAREVCDEANNRPDHDAPNSQVDGHNGEPDDSDCNKTGVTASLVRHHSPFLLVPRTGVEPVT